MKVQLLIPVFNDWASLDKLLKDLDAQAATLPGTDFHAMVINDGSTLAGTPSGPWPHLRGVEVADLVANFGHQRALACGLGLAAGGEVDQILLMDGDGEDRPEDIPSLLAASGDSHIAVARRKKRSEGPGFRAGYLLYKWLFLLATGRWIYFGNFMTIPRTLAEPLSHSPHAGNHLAAAIMRLRLPVQAVDVARGRRFDGKSQMSYVTLVLHGLSAISVFAEMVLTRTLLFLGALAGASALGLLTVAAVRSFTDLAIPGWATYVSLALLALIFQAMMGALFLTFLSLALRQIPAWIPAEHARASIRMVRKLK
ncbi:MAG: glycosyltransferase family 2 protein [Bdellovibrionales bacterium]|nr:glycosyltransferase family 2 protein [Bdellovibrionales bacterium]